MEKKRYAAPMAVIIENRLEQALLAGSNRLDDDFSVDFSPATMEEGSGSDAASRVWREGVISL